LKLVTKFEAPEFLLQGWFSGAERAAVNRAFSLLVAHDCYAAYARIIFTPCPYFWFAKKGPV
jgi:hypothetical protein